MKTRTTILALAAGSLFSAMPMISTAAEYEVRLMTLDPGHFHAGLVQKFMYPQVDPVVHIYSPGGADLDQHVKRIESYNARPENPTKWDLKIYTEPDFEKKMLKEKPGNVVVLSGNNEKKTKYIYDAVSDKLNVLADKPMAITPDDFPLLRKAFARAAKHKVLLYDIMTERYEITSIVQRELARNAELFGRLERGTPDYPAVIMENVHHYFKEVSGKPLVRPAWFYDVRQQGEAVPDVGTHLVDLVQWECFPDQIIDWKKDINVYAAKRWPTVLTKEQFKRSTTLDEYPDYLKKDVTQDGRLAVYQNGEVRYTIRGVHAKVIALWNYEPPSGAKDSHYSMMRGTRAQLTIKQGPEQKYAPVLYVENRVARENFDKVVQAAIKEVQAQWPGVEVKPSSVGNGFEVVIPEKYVVGHEAHFAQVTERYLSFLKEGQMPAWEVPNMIAKYFTTTSAYKLSRK